MSKIYTALGANVFVKEIERETKIGDLYIPDSLDADFVFGEVISAGPGNFVNGSFIPTNVVPGDMVAFNKVSGTKISLNGMKLIRVNAHDIIAKEVEGEILDNW